MTTNARKWEKRVARWRASGLSGPQFCKGRPFTPERLRVWAHRLSKRQTSQPVPAPSLLPLARVIITSRSPEDVPAERKAETATGVPETQGEAALVLEAQGVRISLRPGFHRPTLASVLQVLDQHAALTRRSP